MSEYIDSTYTWCLLISNGLAFILLYESFFMLLKTNIAKLPTDKEVIKGIKGKRQMVLSRVRWSANLLIVTLYSGAKRMYNDHTSAV